MSVEGIVDTQQYLSFRLNDEEFALEITKVHEVLDLPKITRIPQTPDFMKGVINLRGAVVPVMDLNKKFAVRDTEKTMNTRIIISEVSVEGTDTILGVLADTVNEVMEIEPENIEPTPRIGTQMKADFIKGMGKKDDEFIMILNIDKVFSEEELLSIRGFNHASPSPGAIAIDG